MGIGTSSGPRFVAPLRNKAVIRITTFAAAACVLLLSTRAPAQEQPFDKQSTIAEFGGGAITDSDFALFIRPLLIKDEMSNALDAKFFFQTCFGGGMLDNIDRDLGTKVKWVGGSASRHDEESWGYDNRRMGGETHDFWTETLAPKLAVPNKPVLQSLNEALEQDPRGPFAPNPANRKENPTIVFRNGGEMITLDNPAATSHHAILWAGHPNQRHFEDVKQIRESLVARWGDPATNPNVTISVLFGNGLNQNIDPASPRLPTTWNAKPATFRDLADATFQLRNLMSPTEQFLFYASDHGGSITNFKAIFEQTVTITPAAPFLDTWRLFPGELSGMQTDEGNAAQLRIQYQGLDNAAPVFINDVQIGMLPAGQSFFGFLVPESLLNADNTFRIESGGDASFLLHEALFYTGNINTAIPEPASAAGVLVLLLALRRRRSVAGRNPR